MARKQTGNKPWERQQNESPQAFEAFDLYLKMGTDRSCHKVAEQLSKSDTIIKRWSARWNWTERVREHDGELQRAAFEAERKAVKEMRERQMSLGKLMQKKAFDALKKVDIDELTPQEILKFIAEGAKLETAARIDTVRRLAEVEEEDEATESRQVIIINDTIGRKRDDKGNSDK